MSIAQLHKVIPEEVGSGISRGERMLNSMRLQVGDVREQKSNNKSKHCYVSPSD